MSTAKTVAIIGAGPVGLAAAVHVLERGHDARGNRSRLRGRSCGPPVAPCPAFLTLGIQRRSRRRATARANRMEFSGSPGLSDRRGTLGAVSDPARNPHGAQERDPHVEPRHRHFACRLRQGKDERPRKRPRSRYATRTASKTAVLQSPTVQAFHAASGNPGPCGIRQPRMKHLPGEL
jgi:hypothetical protein